MNKALLHIEGLAVLLVSLYFYSIHDFSWILFILLLLAPDLSMLGYVINIRTGTLVYNLFHTYVVPIGVVFIGILLDSDIALAIGIIWVAHIGMDRMLGYGLKYQTDFKDTHLNRV
ncbi:DUF4260 domain-containing protein [Fredinandcohnia humi]